MLPREQRRNLMSVLIELDELNRRMVEPILGRLPTFLNSGESGLGQDIEEGMVQICLREGGRLVTRIGVLEGDGRFASFDVFNALYGGRGLGQGWEERIYPWHQEGVGGED